ncbi:MAG: QueT transporter family protein [Hungatella sp.]|nr:QueT transporter family protein [Hungatella sp.]
MKNSKSDKTIYFMVHGAVIAAIYTVLTMLFAPISFGPVQFRISEALCILPFFTPAAIPGLFLGCFLSNLLCGSAMLDVVFGSIATLLGALGSYRLRKTKWAVCIPPIASNTIIIPWVLRYAYGSVDLIPVAMLTVGIGEILAIGVLGNMLLVMLERYGGLFKRITVKNS